MFLSLVLGNYADCSPLADLAYGLGMSLFSSSKLRNLNCCGDGNIGCDYNDRVEYIDWSGKSFGGIFNVTALNLLTKLEHFDINLNSLDGELPQFPLSLVYLDVSENLFNGSIPVFISNSLETFRGNDNNFSGDLPVFPNSLIEINVENNLVAGTLSMLRPSRINLRYTLVNFIWISNSYDLSQRDCDISYSKIYIEDSMYLYNDCRMLGLLNRPKTSTMKKLTTLSFKLPFSSHSALSTSFQTPQSQKLTSAKTSGKESSALPFVLTSNIWIEGKTALITGTVPSDTTQIPYTSSEIFSLTLTSQLTNPISTISTIVKAKLTGLNNPKSSTTDPLYSYFESSMEDPSSTNKINSQNANGDTFNITADKLFQNPIFYGCIVVFFSFTFGMLFARESQKRRRAAIKAKKQNKNGDGESMLSFRI